MFTWKCSKCGLEQTCAVDEFEEEYKDLDISDILGDSAPWEMTEEEALYL